jgi:hypothetical protein
MSEKYIFNTMIKKYYNKARAKMILEIIYPKEKA